MIDLIFIAQSEPVRYEDYSAWPLDRIELYRDLVYPRMIHYEGRFYSHVELIGLFARKHSSRNPEPLNVWNLPSLTGMHIANYLLSHGILTALINNFDAEIMRFENLYRNANPKPYVGISTTFHLNTTELKRISQVLLKIDPNMKILIGGPFIHSLFENEGEEAVRAILDKFKIMHAFVAFHSEFDLKDFLLSKVNATSTFNRINREDKIPVKHRWNTPLLDEIPELWNRLDLPFLRSTIQVRTSCGCPFHCSFCSYPIVAKGFQTISSEAFEKQLECMMKLPDIQQIIFIDDTFNVPKERFHKICRSLQKYSISWYSFLRAQFVDDETARLMSESGCKAVYLGIESGSDTILKNMNKRAKRDDYEKGAKLLRRYGISALAAFIIGFPGETDETLKETVDFIENSGVDFYTLKEFFYIKGTKIYQDRDRFSLVGMGNSWSHSTMDSKTASIKKLQIFCSVKNSIFVDPDTSLWQLALLGDAGYSMADIKILQEIINSIVKDQVAGVGNTAHPGFQRLKDYFI